MSINIPHPQPSAPYDTLQDALNLARTRLNDAIIILGGEILTDTAAFTQTMSNGAWRKFQAFLANLGFSRFRDRIVLNDFPPVGTNDVSSECYLDWVQYFDGVSYYIPTDVDVLPQNFILPLRISERQAGSNTYFRPMQMVPDGFHSRRKNYWNSVWDWRDDKIYFPGSLARMDLEVEYSRYLSDFVTVGEIQWYNQPIPIMRALSPMANFICYEFAMPRGDLNAIQFINDAKDELKQLYNNEVGMKQRTNPSRRPFSGRGSRRVGYNFGGY